MAFPVFDVEGMEAGIDSAYSLEVTGFLAIIGRFTCTGYLLNLGHLSSALRLQFSGVLGAFNSWYVYY